MGESDRDIFKNRHTDKDLEEHYKVQGQMFQEFVDNKMEVRIQQAQKRNAERLKRIQEQQQKQETPSPSP